MKPILIALLLFFSLPALGQEITISGTMHHSSIEGGCWYLQADGGKRFELVGDTQIVYPLRVEGEHVAIDAVVMKHAASTCMMGEIVRVIRRIDTVRYPIDLPIMAMRIDGTMHLTTEGIWYVKTSHGQMYEFQKPPANRYRHIGASIHERFRVLLDKHSTRTNKDGVILPPSKPPARRRAIEKKYDPR